MAQINQQVRARDLGIPFDGIVGTFNAITDVAGVEVGFVTLTSEDHNINTGVTAILPCAKNNNPVYANWYALNGNGEMTGTTWITESGFLETPILITNTNSIGVVRDALLQWFVDNNWYKEDHWYTYPVVAETYDGILNDIYGFHVTKEHTYQAMNNATCGPISEGNIGGGNGTINCGFKGGTGTSSRILNVCNQQYTIGVLVQSNMGKRENLNIAGVPIGKELKDVLPFIVNGPSKKYTEGDGSIIIIIATDAPLLPHQLKKLSQRAALGVGNVGGKGENGSGDIFLTFSTANKNAFNRDEITTVEQLPNDQLNPLFEATIQATEEAIINSMVAATTMTGYNNNIVHALPHDLLLETLSKYGRIK